LDVLRLLSSHDIERLRTSPIWNIIKEALERLRGQLTQATSILGKYGVRSEDLVVVVSKRLRIKNHEMFVKNIFEKL
jgi:hypothetical protein